MQGKPAYIAPAHLQRRLGNVGGIDLRARKSLGTGQRNRTGPGADVQNAAYAPCIDPRPEATHRKLGDGRARHQHTLIDIQLKTGKKRPPRQIGQRDALGDATPQQLLDARNLARLERRGVGGGAARVRKSGGKKHQLRRFVARIVGAVAEMDARGTQGPRAA